LRRKKRNGKVMDVDPVGRLDIKRKAVACKKKPTLKNTRKMRMYISYMSKMKMSRTL
jgi:hypothetical protein